MEGIVGYGILLLGVGSIVFFEIFFEIGIAIICRKKARGSCKNVNCKFIPWCDKPPRREPRKKNP